MRLFALLWPFHFGLRLDWLTTTVPNPAPEEARGQVYLLRGNAAVFSQGFGLMCDQFRRAGWYAEDLRCMGDRRVRRRLIADRQAGKARGPVVMIGHSCGGRYALFTAQELQRRGIGVDLIVCFDVAGPYPVAANVGTAIHLFRSRWRIYPARPLVPAPGSAARIENVDLDSPDAPLQEPWIHHLNITARPSLQAWVVQRVLELG